MRRVIGEMLLRRKGVNIFHRASSNVARIFSLVSSKERAKHVGLFLTENDEEEGSISACCYTLYGAYSRIGRNKRARLNSTL